MTAKERETDERESFLKREILNERKGTIHSLISRDFGYFEKEILSF